MAPYFRNVFMFQNVFSYIYFTFLLSSNVSKNLFVVVCISPIQKPSNFGCVWADFTYWTTYSLLELIFFLKPWRCVCTTLMLLWTESHGCISKICRRRNIAKIVFNWFSISKHANCRRNCKINQQTKFNLWDWWFVKFW